MKFNFLTMAEVLAVAAGMVVFALFSHQGWPWILVGVAGLLVAAIAIEQSLRRTPRVGALLGLDGFSQRTALLSVVGCELGAGAGLLHRWQLDLPLLPAGGLEVFAAIACLIGATEELVYRGWLQGRLRTLGWPVAVVVAAAAHAAYKSALFAWSPGSAEIDCAVVARWTFGGGVIFGLLRQVSGSVAPSMVAHAAFDLLVYGALARAPWWVWR
jgi:membrane protease YdiL (CAAX protease family)